MNNPSAYERRKDPEGVRSALIDAAARMIAEKGLNRLTIDAVAKAAGVTKGGLFHHFATKDDLIQGVQNAMIDIADATISAAMAADPEPHGSFSRAYLMGVMSRPTIIEDLPTHTLCMAMLADPKLQDDWFDWVGRQVDRYATTDDNPSCALVRLAADGIWLNSLRLGGMPPPVSPDVVAALVALTHPSP